MALKANVAIETILRSGKTVLKKSFCDAPFKLANITEDAKGKALQLMLMSSSPGMLDEDKYNFQIRLGEGTHTTLQTQSYQRIFQMKKGAVQQMNVVLESGASFVYLPHPSVPHKDAVFSSRNKIFLTKDCSLIWGELLSCGRKWNDEVFQFTSYHSLTEFFFDGRLAVKENLFLQPATMNVIGTGQLEGYTHQATLLCFGQQAVVDEVAAWLEKEIRKGDNTIFGVSALPVDGFVVRLLGHNAEPVFDLLKRVAAKIKERDTRPVLNAKLYV